MATIILRLPEVLRRRGGRSRSTHYLDIKNGLFTPPIAIGSRSVGWPEEEVDALINGRIAGEGDPEIRSLVLRLMAARKGKVRGHGHGR